MLKLLQYSAHHAITSSAAVSAVTFFFNQPKGSQNKSLFGDASKNMLTRGGICVKIPKSQHSLYMMAYETGLNVKFWSIYVEHKCQNE